MVEVLIDDVDDGNVAGRGWVSIGDPTELVRNGG
jgi:hypothetical protein